MILFISVLSFSGSPGSNGCLQNIACQQPQQARKYAAAGDMLLRTAKTLSFEPGDNYEYVLQELQEAADWGSAGGECSRFKCGTETKPPNN